MQKSRVHLDCQRASSFSCIQKSRLRAGKCCRRQYLQLYSAVNETRNFKLIEAQEAFFVQKADLIALNSVNSSRIHNRFHKCNF